MPPEAALPEAAPPRLARVPFLDLAALTAEIRHDLDDAIARVLNHGQYILGAELASFEREFAAYTETSHAVGVASGLDALILILRALGVGPGDEVIVPGLTFAATWLAASEVGARPVGVDPDPATLVIDPAAVARAISPRTRAVIPVHLYGQPADMSAINDMARQHGIAVIEDAAQAHGARDNGHRCGGLGTAAGWSFYPAKNLGAYGDGGAVTTNNAALADRIRELRNYGSTVKYVHESRGINSRLDELQAAILRTKLPHLDRWNARRTAIANRYLAELADTGLTLPAVRAGAETVWHLFVVQSASRDRLQQQLGQAGVECHVHYPIPPYRQPAYAGTLAGVHLPISDRAHEQVLSLPIGPHMSDAQVDHVIDAVRAVCERLES